MAISKKAGGKKGGNSSSKPLPSKNAPSSSKGGVAKADWREGFKKPQAGVSDMTLLSKVSNEAVNENLQKRFQNKEIYHLDSSSISISSSPPLLFFVLRLTLSSFFHLTFHSPLSKTYIGNVLISVNPFRDLGIYTNEILSSYRGKNRLEMSPHVYAIAEGSYYNMMAYKENQCVIISGESGAGKTEAAKRIMQYIAAVSGGSEKGGINDIKDMVLATNPLLESFGCAKTLRNNNSSRHGKYLEIMFNEQERNLENDAAILWLGNCSFKEDKDGNAEIADQGVPDFVAYLLEVDSANVTKALTQRIMETTRGGSVYEVPLNPAQASSVRDALSKAIYNNLFDWIVARVNKSMVARSSATNTIGVLDIYGFEIFETILSNNYASITSMRNYNKSSLN
ncbi:hypothetical protein L7F22_039650 [Adiantum nelumboides]|nr:hypothetical protein [Adiantum nelumboides]